MIRFHNVYQTNDAERLLYLLLQERPEAANISHKEMPTYSEHRAFIRSSPYQHWYLIACDGVWVGSIYLTMQREVGIFIFEDQQGKGYASQAIEKIRKLHPGEILANIAPGNEKSIKLFKKLGFKHIQNTYRVE